MKTWIRTSFLVACLCFQAAFLQADQVDEYLRAQLQKLHLPGLALAVTHHGSVVKLSGYGLADVEQEVPVTPATVFQIQSVTKQFVATAIMILVEEGRVSVDAKVSEYLEPTPESWKTITIRHLLTQTSGIKDFINDPTASLRLETTDDEVLKAAAARPLNFTPGEKYAYSNTNYQLLAMIIKKVTGDSYGAFLKKRVFDPLAMSDTRVVSWSDIVPHRAAGYGWRDGRLCRGEFVAESILAYGGGGLLSTAADMAKWDLGLRDEKILKQAALEQMWTPAKLNNGSRTQYGFGWGIGGERPHREVQHSGGHITGFSSHIVRFLDDDLSIIILVNAGYANPGKLAHAVAGFYVPTLKPPERKAIDDNEPAVTDLLRRTERMIRQGKLDEDIFTPDLRSLLESSLGQSSSEAKAAGAFGAIELLEKPTASDGLRQYLYRLRFTNLTLLVRLKLDPESKIAELNTEVE